jgi:hypothetical protein
MAVDIERVVTAAVDSFVQGQDDDRTGRRRGGRRRRGRARAFAVGVGLGIAARVAYERVRTIDLESAASAIEERLER